MVDQRLRRAAVGVGRFAETVEGPRLGVAVPALADEGERPAVAFGAASRFAETGVRDTEVVHDRGLRPAVAELAVPGDRLLAEVGGRPVVAELTLDVAEHGPGVGLADRIARPHTQVERLPEMVGGGRVTTQAGLDDTEVDQRAGLPGRVAGPPEQRPRLFMMVGGGGEPAEPLLDVAEVAEHPCLAERVVRGPEQLQRRTQVVDGRLVSAQAQVGGAEAEERVPLADDVVSVPRALLGPAVQDEGVVRMAAVEVPVQRGGEPDQVGGRGLDRHRDQGGPFRVEPGQRGIRVADVRKRGSRPAHAWPLTCLGRIQRVHRRGRHGEIVVGHPGQRGPQDARRVLVTGTVRGVHPNQVVEGVSPWPGGLDQVVAAESAQR